MGTAPRVRYENAVLSGSGFWPYSDEISPLEFLGPPPLTPLPIGIGVRTQLVALSIALAINML